MKEPELEENFVEKILHIAYMMEEKQIDPDRLDPDDISVPLLPPDEMQDFRTAYEVIRFVDEIPGGFFIYSATGNEQILYANRGMLRLFQCENMKQFRELTGNSFRGIVHPEDLEAVEKSIQKQIFQDKRDLDYVEYRIQCRDGSIRWVEDYGHFIHGKTGDIFYVFLGESTDERSHQQMEQRQLLSEALERANLAVKAKNTFLSNISHEMRTPLNAIFGFTSLAKINLHDPESAEDYLDRVESASHQLLDMISQVLDVSALSVASDPSEVECDLCRTVQDVYDFLLPQAQEKNISFTLDYSAISHRNIYADQEKLKQLVLNLTNNAITYTNSGGAVSVSLQEERELPNSYAVYRFVVQDNGIGISKEFIASVFDPFSREKTSTLSGIHGLGLGLTIVKNIVDMMGGTVDVKSELDKGSIFTVTIPFRTQSVPVEDDESDADISPSLHVLLVEDNEINLEIETELLERIGFVIEPAENGQIAVDKMRNASPGDFDLIIMDLQMPVMNGWDASAAIRRLPDPIVSKTPIIALSANVLISDQRKSMECGIDYHLSKPMDLPVLLETIEKILKKSAR